jgi:hypothetical protein
VLGEAALALLREQEPVVREHIELARLALGGGRLVLRALVDLGRETRGPAVIAVSDGAVKDADVGHDASLSAPPRLSSCSHRIA